jgi:hypothetical protein
VTTPPRPADRITAFAGSVDLSGFAPFLSPVMFFLNENSWQAMTLIVSLAAISLTTLSWSAGARMHDRVAN